MKKQFLFLLFVPLSNYIFSQADVAGLGGHVRATGYYVGWDNTGTPGPLEIRNDFNQPINIYTSGSQRMSIRPNGRVGINSANRLSLSI